MKWKAIGMTLAASLTLVGCQNAENELGQGVDETNEGVQQTRFNGTTDYPNNNDNNGITGNMQNNQGRVQDRNQDNNDNNLNTRNNGNNLNTGNAGNTGNNGNNGNTQNNQNGQNGQYDVSDQAAERISNDVKGIDQVYVLTTENNAYVAAELNANNQQNNQGGENEVSDKVRSQITKIVKSVDKDIDNVYVSTNPDFVNLTNNYVNDVENGDPVQGFFQEFGNMVDRIFPQAE
jgi:spore cortex protein